MGSRHLQSLPAGKFSENLKRSKLATEMAQLARYSKHALTLSQATRAATANRAATSLVLKKDNIFRVNHRPLHMWGDMAVEVWPYVPLYGIVLYIMWGHMAKMNLEKPLPNKTFPVKPRYPAKYLKRMQLEGKPLPHEIKK